MFWEKDKEDTQTMKTPSQIEETPSQIEEMPSQIEEKTPSQIEKNESQKDELREENDKEIELLKKQADESPTKIARLNREMGMLQYQLEEKRWKLSFLEERTDQEIDKLKADNSDLTAQLEEARAQGKDIGESV